MQRARDAGGVMILRNDDLDRARCRPEFVAAMIEDLKWIGCDWTEGPDVGGPFSSYNQSERLAHYVDAFEKLRAAGTIYPCLCSRRDVQAAAAAPHENGDEPVYPGTCRPEHLDAPERERRSKLTRDQANWRFRIPDARAMTFVDGHSGPQRAVFGVDLGDFVIWRKEGLPSYQLACAADDAAMRITEVVRGADLILSTFRQLLLFEALGLPAPDYYHCPLVTDDSGVRLAKRHDALSIRALRERGMQPESL